MDKEIIFKYLMIIGFFIIVCSIMFFVVYFLMGGVLTEIVEPIRYEVNLSEIYP